MNSKEKIDNRLSGLNFYTFLENHTIYDYANVFRYRMEFVVIHVPFFQKEVLINKYK